MMRPKNERFADDADRVEPLFRNWDPFLLSITMLLGVCCLFGALISTQIGGLTFNKV